MSFSLTEEARNKTSALVANINNTYFEREIYTTAEQKAVAYLYFIIKNHPFIDGNKRTATLAFEVVCALNDLNPDYGDFSLDELAIFIEKVQIHDHQHVILMITTLLFKK